MSSYTWKFATNLLSLQTHKFSSWSNISSVFKIFSSKKEKFFFPNPSSLKLFWGLIPLFGIEVSRNWMEEILYIERRKKKKWDKNGKFSKDYLVSSHTNCII